MELNLQAINNLNVGDYIAFGFDYNGGEPTSIEVTNITEIYRNENGDVELILVHCLYGHKSISEHIKPENVIAVGDKNGRGSIVGFSGMFEILHPNHPLLVDENE